MTRYGYDVIPPPIIYYAHSDYPFPGFPNGYFFSCWRVTGCSSCGDIRPDTFMQQEQLDYTEIFREKVQMSECEHCSQLMPR